MIHLELSQVSIHGTGLKSLIVEANKLGLKFVSDVIKIDSKRFKQFIDKLTEQNPDNVCNTIAINNRFYIIRGDWAIIIYADHMECVFLYGWPATYNSLLKEYTEYFTVVDQDTVTVCYFFKDVNGVNYANVNIKQSQITNVYSELYPDIDIDILNNDFKNSKESILFLTGKPGVGKTSFIRYMLKNYKMTKPKSAGSFIDEEMPNVAYIKDTALMAESEFWSTMASKKFDLIIFDDLDNALSSREEGNNSNFVNNLLSYSDGIFGITSRIVITTNMEVKNIDQALLRPGRCFDFLELNPLTSQEALRIWQEVLEMDIVDADTSWASAKEVTQASLMSHYHRVSSDKHERAYIKHGPKTYSVEQKIQSLMNNRKLGFNALA